MAPAALPWPAQLWANVHVPAPRHCAACRGCNIVAAARHQDGSMASSSRNSSRVRRQRHRADSGDVNDIDIAETARLRRLVRDKGRDAVVDKDGFVKLDAASSVSRNSNSSAGSPPQQQQPDVPQQDASSNSSSMRQSLFSNSQLQSAAERSRQSTPVLPIVRPADSNTSSITSLSPNFFSSSTWSELGASTAVVDALKSLGVTRPSHVQAEAFKALKLRSGLRHVAIADQAGSGKTLAYLLPLLQQFKQRESERDGDQQRKPGCPAIIILTPTVELAQQVGRVVKAVSHAGLKVRTAVMTGGQAEADKRNKTFRTQCDQLAAGVDVLVATPGRLIAHLEKGSLLLDNTDAIVMDEVDVLAGVEASYAEHVAPLRAASPSVRFVLVSATLPQHTFDELQELFPGLGAAFGPGLHRTATGCVEELVDCSGGDEISLETGTDRKLEAMMDALARVRSPRVVVFCNKIETCRVVENALRRQQSSYSCQVLAYHEAIREDLRTAALNNWLTAPSPSAPPKVLVCTDRTSRGIDSMWCDHVVLFEFPRDPSEYVRRVGRTARGAGGRGVVTVLVLGKQVALAKEIMERNKAGAPVHRVPRVWTT